MIYKILTGKTPEDLDKRVNDYIKNGYYPQGGPSIIQGKVDVYREYKWEAYGQHGSGDVKISFMQAVVKEHPKQKVNI